MSIEDEIDNSKNAGVETALEGQEIAKEGPEVSGPEQETLQIQEKMAEGTSKLEVLKADLKATEETMLGLPERVAIQVRVEVENIRQEIEALSVEVQVLQQRLDALNEQQEKSPEGGVDESQTEKVEGNEQEAVREIEDFKKELERLTKIIELGGSTGNSLIRLTELNSAEMEEYVLEMNHQCEKAGLVSDFKLNEILSNAGSKEEKDKIETQYQADFNSRYKISVDIQHQFYRKFRDKIVDLRAGLKKLEETK